MSKPSQQVSVKEGRIIFQFMNAESQEIQKVDFPLEILNFNIELLNNNHDEAYPIPSEVVDSLYPFEIMKNFLQAHQYTPKYFKVTKPVNSKNYQDLVDDITYKTCQQFTQLQNAQNATQVISLCQFIRFHQLRDAVCAAIATNYYIPPNDEKALSDFRKIHKLQTSSEETCEIIKEYEDFFNIIEAKAKEDFLRTQQEFNQGNSGNS